MDGKKLESNADESRESAVAGEDAERAEGPKEYKKPTIRRHGNLRLMTQLE